MSHTSLTVSCVSAQNNNKIGTLSLVHYQSIHLFQELTLANYISPKQSQNSCVNISLYINYYARILHPSKQILCRFCSPVN